LRRDAAGIVRDRLIGEVYDREQLAVAVEVDVEAPGDLRVLVAALLAEPVELGIRDADEIADPVTAAAGLELQLLKVVASAGQAQLCEGLLRRRLGGQADDAAGRIAVQGRARAPDHLDLARRAQIDAVHRALAVRQRL